MKHVCRNENDNLKPTVSCVLENLPFWNGIFFIEFHSAESSVDFFM